MSSGIGCTVSFVTSGLCSTTLGREEGGGGTWGALYETPLRVVIAFISPFGLAMVLLGREPEPEVEAALEFTNMVSIFESLPLIHLVFEEPELGKLELGKPEVD
ncbi:hypothetical protein Tco_0063126 [Tanacetum coccineum]